MANPFTTAAGWLLGNPLVSHAVVASALTAAGSAAGHVAGIAHAPVIAAGVISAVYYGREAGQLEHDLKHGTTSHGVVSPFLAFAGAEFGFLWSLDNLLQFLAAAGASAGVAAALTLTGN
jgi:hypothetical protein